MCVTFSESRSDLGTTNTIISRIEGDRKLAHKLTLSLRKKEAIVDAGRLSEFNIRGLLCYSSILIV